MYIHTPESGRSALQPEAAVIQEFFHEPADMYMAILAGSYRALTNGPTTLDAPDTTERADNANAILFAIASDRPELSSVADAALAQIKRPAATWQAASWLDGQTGQWPEQYEILLKDAAMRAKRDPDRAQSMFITQMSSKIAASAIAASAETIAEPMDQTAEAPDAAAQAMLDIQRSIGGVMLGASVYGENLLGEPDPNIVLLESLLKGHHYSEAAACFENALCFGGNDDSTRMQAAGLMVKYEVADKLPDNLLDACRILGLLECSKPIDLSDKPIEQGKLHVGLHEAVDDTTMTLDEHLELIHQAENKDTRLKMKVDQTAQVSEVMRLADTIMDISERARVLLTCKWQADRLELAPPPISKDGRTLKQLLQSAWTKWAHMLPDDGERVQRAELAVSLGVDVDERYPSL